MQDRPVNATHVDHAVPERHSRRRPRLGAAMLAPGVTECGSTPIISGPSHGMWVPSQIMWADLRLQSQLIWAEQRHYLAPKLR
jgi:hypothetical protein